jgi:hypothetical protein
MESRLDRSEVDPDDTSSSVCLIPFPPMGDLRLRAAAEENWHILLREALTTA